MVDGEEGQENGQQQHAAAAAGGLAAQVAVKPPQFDETCAARWFIIVESQFAIGRITSQVTKFHSCLSNLPMSVVSKLSENILTCNNYTTLKDSVIGIYAKASPELFDSIVSQNHVICTKPSLYLNELRKVASQLNVGLSDEFLKIKFLKGLPDSIRPLLVTHEANSLEEIARVADTLIAYSSTNVNTSHVKYNNNFSDNSQSQGPPSHSMNNTHQSMNNPAQYSQPMYNSNQYNPPMNNNASFNYSNRNSTPFNHSSRSHSNQNSSAPSINYSDPSVPHGVRAFHENQRPQVCRSHLYYGNRARSCKRWCMLSSTATNITPDSRPSSRSSSPAPSARFQSGN